MVKIFIISVIIHPLDNILYSFKDEMRLANKTAIITGGGSGIGKASARAFHREGANVVLFGRRKYKLEETAQELGSRVLTVEGDITQSADLHRLVQETQSTFQRIDILVNNAGIFKGAPLHEISDEHYDKIMNINIKAVFQLTRKVLPVMMDQRGGSIIHISYNWI